MKCNDYTELYLKANNSSYNFLKELLLKEVWNTLYIAIWSFILSLY